MFQSTTPAQSRLEAALFGETSLEASDGFEAFDPGCYCPNQLLGTFTLLMAGHGRCVSSAMMLGDAQYAMWQLARARTMGDEQLGAVAARLFAYFDDPRGWAAGMKSGAP
jgi:hypothetical protein